jgi:RNA polymerase sigma factor (sigma-70 family)
VAGVTDIALVAAMVAGDPRGLEGAYRAYAAALLGYCRGLLADADAAADAVQDTFILAGQRAGQLRDPARLKPWLYAIARSVCLRQLRARKRQAPLEEAGDVAAPPTRTDDRHVVELVHTAARALSPGDFQVFDLVVRHDLSVADVAAVLEVTADHAHARLSRARTQLEQCLGALLVARNGTGDCADLAGLLRDWNGELNPLLRKRLVRHINVCPTCAERRRVEFQPAALLSAYGAAPFALAPTALWDRVAAGHLAGSPPAAFDPDTGFPRTGHRRGRGVLAAAAALLGLIAVVVVVLNRTDEAPTVAATASPAVPPTVAVAPPTTEPPLVRPPTTAPVTTAPAPPSVTANGTVIPSCPTYRLAVTANVTGAQPVSAIVYWTYGTAATQSKTMTVDAGHYKAIIGPLSPEAVTFWVVAQTTGGPLTSAKHQAVKPC